MNPTNKKKEREELQLFEFYYLICIVLLIIIAFDYYKSKILQKSNKYKRHNV
jgi:hypothetical protein